MIVSQISITNFRNIQKASIAPSSELTVICGKNGQGKTNLLESIWLLTGSKSFRGSKDVELVKENEEFAIIEGTVLKTHENGESEKDTPKKEIRIAIAGENIAPKGRTAKINGVDYKRATNIAGIVSAVVFDPSHLSLVKGSPDGRRKFLDAALCQLYPNYLSLIRKYTRVLAQKNALLKVYYKTQGAKELLDIYDETLAQCGSKITQKRMEYLSEMTNDIVKNYDDISSSAEKLKIEYNKSFENDNLLSVFYNSRQKDLQAGFCTTGPHREDFTIYINDKIAKSFASQGQQRSAVLSLKLAEATAAKKITGENPIMLLDDVLSELDETRQSYLLNRMKDKQTIVTACDATLFERTNGKIVVVSGGCIKE